MCSLQPVPLSYLCMRMRILGVLKIVCCCTIKPDCHLRLLWSCFLTNSAACVLSFDHSAPLHIYYLSRDSPAFKRVKDINTKPCIRYTMKTQDEMVSECILHWPEGFSVTCGMWQFMWYPLSQPSQNSIKSWQAAKDAVVNNKLLWWVSDRWLVTLRLKDPVDHHTHQKTHTHYTH